MQSTDYSQTVLSPALFPAHPSLPVRGWALPLCSSHGSPAQGLGVRGLATFSMNSMGCSTGICLLSPPQPLGGTALQS